MSKPIAEDLKRDLTSLGVWGDFVRRRADLRAERGLTLVEGNRAVLAELEAAGRIPVGYGDRLPRRGRKAAGTRVVADIAAASAAKSAVGVAEKSDAKPSCAKPSVPDEERASASGGREATREMFAGKRCSVATAFMWAYANIGFSDVAPGDAPSAVAWQMYRDMRASPSMKVDMLKTCLGAAMRKAELEEKTEGKFDGEAEYDLLARMGGVA